jgi:GNAT superfamily N-acetyltransferase
MRVEVKQITTRRETREFIRLPARIHCDHKRWVPPLYADEWRLLNPKKNRAFLYCDATLALAYQSDKVVGRVAGIINHRYNKLRNEQTARFSHLECLDERGVAGALLNYVEEWARGKGMSRVVGPMGFTEQDPEGFLVEGFEHEPALTSYCNYPYIINLVEFAGYIKEVDYVVYTIPVPTEAPELYEKIAARIQTRGTCSLVEFIRRKDLEPFIRPVLQLMNETFRDLSGYSPLDQKEMDDLARRYLPIIDPRFVKVVTAQGEVVGFIVGIPNVNDGLRRAEGCLFPFGWLRIVNAAKRARQLDLLLGGIKEEHRGRGVDVLLGGAMIRSARNAGFTHMDSHHELESNYRVRAEMERVGGTVYKRYRIFQKRL